MKYRIIRCVGPTLLAALYFYPSAPAKAQMFEPVVEYDVIVERPTDVAIADLNGDGHLDLAASCLGWVDNVSVLLGNGDGTFQAAVDYGTGEDPVSVAVDDLNGDGIPDLVSGNVGRYVGSGDVSVLLGNGDGTFQTAVNYGTGNAYGVVTGDLDGDGDTDIAVTISLDSSVMVLLGNGDGTFQPGAEQVLDVGCSSIAIGDLDQDSIPDLVVGSSYWVDDERVFVLLGNGDATFQTAVDCAVGDDGYHAVAIGDLNNDGNPDLATSVDGNNLSVSVLLGNGDGTFQEAMGYGYSDWPESVAIGDLDGDGIPDLVTTGQGYYGHGTTAVLLGKGDGTFLPPLDLETYGQMKSVAVGDLDSDGSLDLALASCGEDNISVLINSGKPVSLFTDFTCAPTSGTVPFYTRMTVRLLNRVPDHTRQVAARIQLDLANGQSFDNWKAGYQSIAGGTRASTSWYQRIPALISLIGKFQFTLFVEDVTPAPWNQPPYPASGYRAEDRCIMYVQIP